jgi:hypothetical protein
MCKRTCKSRRDREMSINRDATFSWCVAFGAYLNLVSILMLIKTEHNLSAMTFAAKVAAKR